MLSHIANFLISSILGAIVSGYLKNKYGAKFSAFVEKLKTKV